ncbi:MAG: ABC transporter permease subunit [Chloroflexota bacterium]|nr:ABC transporter permease subunit [Chloroflexota bacterium]MDE2959931.1 ABC transporter permease subunit [Chloroflexota bacterium]
MAANAQHAEGRVDAADTTVGSRRRRQWTALLREPGTALGLFLVVSLLLAGLLAPWLPLDDPTEIDLPQRLLSPSTEHLLGTDHLGRDTFSRIVHGARMTLLAAAVTLALSMTIALTVGILSGYHGGWLDTALMGVVDLLLAFPSLILALAVAGALGPGLFNVLLAAGAVWWVGHARIIRGVTLGARQMEYVTAARAAGAGNLRIILRHIAPNILGPIIVIASLDVGWIILGIAGLNFLGLGAQPPTPEWGAMLNDARPHLQTAPRLLLLPGAAIFVAVLGFNLLGDGLRDLLDPRTVRQGN